MEEGTSWLIVLDGESVKAKKVQLAAGKKQRERAGSEERLRPLKGL